MAEIVRQQPTQTSRASRSGSGSGRDRTSSSGSGGRSGQKNPSDPTKKRKKKARRRLRGSLSLPAPPPQLPPYDAGFVKDLTIPDRAHCIVGSALKKVWSIRNTGSLGWLKNVKLMYLGGELPPTQQHLRLTLFGQSHPAARDGYPSVAERLPYIANDWIPATPAGKTCSVMVEIRVPSYRGIFTGIYQLMDPDKNFFGPRLSVCVVTRMLHDSPPNSDSEEDEDDEGDLDLDEDYQMDNFSTASQSLLHMPSGSMLRGRGLEESIVGASGDSLDSLTGSELGGREDRYLEAGGSGGRGRAAHWEGRGGPSFPGGQPPENGLDFEEDFETGRDEDLASSRSTGMAWSADMDQIQEEDDLNLRHSQFHHHHQHHHHLHQQQQQQQRGRFGGFPDPSDRFQQEPGGGGGLYDPYDDPRYEPPPDFYDPARFQPSPAGDGGSGYEGQFRDSSSSAAAGWHREDSDYQLHRGGPPPPPPPPPHEFMYPPGGLQHPEHSSRPTFPPTRPPGATDPNQPLSPNTWIQLKDIKWGVRIGKGAYGEVFEGTLWGQPVAIKKLFTRGLREKDLKNFEKEIRIMQALRHPNIVEFLGAIYEKPLLCLITEYMPRGSLDDLLIRHRESDPPKFMSNKRILRYAKEIAKGLNWLHHRGIIHRDLKTDNVLVGENNHLKLCDFGLSHIKSRQYHDTGLYGICGTPCYMAPEVIKKQPYGVKCDVFSFGMVLLELVMGEYPLEHITMPSDSDTFDQVIADGFRPPIPDYCHPDFRVLIERCWSTDPDDRPSVDETIEILNEIERKMDAEVQDIMEDVSDEVSELFKEQQKRIAELELELRKALSEAARERRTRMDLERWQTQFKKRLRKQDELRRKEIRREHQKKVEAKKQRRKALKKGGSSGGASSGGGGSSSSSSSSSSSARTASASASSDSLHHPQQQQQQQQSPHTAGGGGGGEQLSSAPQPAAGASSTATAATRRRKTSVASGSLAGAYSNHRRRDKANQKKRQGQGGPLAAAALNPRPLPPKPKPAAAAGKPQQTPSQ